MTTATRDSDLEKITPPTLIAVILDESGSMGQACGEVIAGFNDFLEEQTALPDSSRLSLTKFSTLCTLLYPPTPLAQVPSLGRHNYTPGGGTALFDAIAETVRVAQEHKHHNERVLCLIITDGRENASRETTRQQVTEIIKALEATGDWTFVYIGVRPDQFVRDMNLAGTRTATNTAPYNPTAPRESWDTMSEQTTFFRVRRERSTGNFYEPMTGQADSFTPDPPPDVPGTTAPA